MVDLRSKCASAVMLFTSVGGIPTRKKCARCEHPTMGLKDTLICLTPLIPLSVPVLTDVKGVCVRYAACYAVINKCHNTMKEKLHDEH